MEWTILDPYGTPYGGVRDNIDLPIHRGGSSYESPKALSIYPYGSLLAYLDEFGNQSTGGVA